MNIRRWFGTTVLLLVCGLRAFCAQYVIVEKSIEATIAQSSRVVVAKLVEIGEPTITDGTITRQPVVLEIQETLKGPQAQGESFNFTWLGGVSEVGAGRPSKALLEKWRSAGDRLLVATGHDVMTGPTVIDLDQKDLSVWTQEFVQLKTPDKVLEAAKRAAIRYPVELKPQALHEVPIPNEPLWHLLVVPVEAAT